jgi:acyl-CoA oxidase
VAYERWLRDGASIAEDGTYHDPLDAPDLRSRRSVGMSRFAWGGVTAGLSAAARSSVAIALTHARHRKTFDRLAGQVIALEHLNQQRLLFSAAASALAATVVARRATNAAWHIPPGGGRGSGPAGPVMRELGLAKITVAVLADTAVTRSRTACGAAGFFSENRLIGHQSLTMAFQHGGGDNRLIALEAAWSMATGPDYHPPVPETGDWLALFRNRERLLHAELTSSLPAAVDFDAWNRRTELAQRFADAHTARTTAEALHDEWNSPTVLEDLFQLYCLEQVTADAGWCLAHGLITAAEVLALPERTNKICRRLAHHADDLIELLAVPAELRPDGLLPGVS